MGYILLYLQLLLVYCSTTLGKDLGDVFTSLSIVSEQSNIATDPGWYNAVLGFEISASLNAQQGDTFSLVLPCVNQITQNEQNIEITEPNGASFATCLPTNGRLSSDSSLLCSLNSAAYSTVSGSMSFDLFFNLGGTNNAYAMKCASTVSYTHLTLPTN